MKKKLIIFYLVLLFSRLDAFEIKQNNGSDFVKKQNLLINDLFIHKKYFDCIAETGRLLQYTTNKSLAREYDYFISLNYFLGGQHAVVADRASYNETRHRIPDVRDALLVSRSFMKRGNTEKAGAALHSISYETTEKKFQFDLFIRRTELLVLADSYDDALNEISRYEKLSPGAEEISSLRKDISRYNTLKKKSPLLSAGLSAVLPGAGQTYCGRYGEALLSFAAVALSGAGTWYAMDRGEKSLGMTLGFFTVLLYSGNLYGAYNSAHSFNRRMYSSFRSEILSTHVPDYDPASFIDMKKVFR